MFICLYDYTFTYVRIKKYNAQPPKQHLHQWCKVDMPYGYVFNKKYNAQPPKQHLHPWHIVEIQRALGCSFDSVCDVNQVFLARNNLQDNLVTFRATLDGILKQAVVDDRHIFGGRDFSKWYGIIHG